MKSKQNKEVKRRPYKKIRFENKKNRLLKQYKNKPNYNFLSIHIHTTAFMWCAHEINIIGIHIHLFHAFVTRLRFHQPFLLLLKSSTSYFLMKFIHMLNRVPIWYKFNWKSQTEWGKKTKKTAAAATKIVKPVSQSRRVIWAKWQYFSPLHSRIILQLLEMISWNK